MNELPELSDSPGVRIPLIVTEMNELSREWKSGYENESVHGNARVCHEKNGLVESPDRIEFFIYFSRSFEWANF